MNNTTKIAKKKNAFRVKEPGEYHWSQVVWVVFILAHVLLALAMNASRLVSTIHAILTLVIGLFLVVTTRNPRRVTWITAYICGSEILWRMTEAQVFWEYGKYAIILLMIISLLRMKIVENLKSSVMYFLPLLFSIPLTILNQDIETARQVVSSNLSGPLSLAISILFFSQISLNWKDREVLMWCIVVPIMGIASLCIRGIITAEELVFRTESSFTTSGGYGPNQVSSLLGLASLVLILLAVQERNARRRLIPLSLAVGLLTLSALTFSRGGLYNVAASIVVLIAFSLRSDRLRKTLIPILFIAFFVGAFFIFPRLNNFTDGMLEVRFADTDLTGRTELMQADLDVWKKHPFMGVGPGMSAFARKDILGRTIAAHTEYTRLLSEHGIWGITSTLILLIIGFKTIKNSPLGLAQGWTAALVIWPLMVMTNAAMRFAAIGYIFGLATAKWIDKNKTNESAINR